MQRTKFTSLSGFFFLYFVNGALTLRFTLPVYEREVPETFPEGGYEVPPDGFLRVLCNDEITGNQINTVEYSISGGNRGPFQLNSTNGQLSVTNGSILDYETDQSFSFTIMCTDTSNTAMTATAQVIITILPVNEFQPVLSTSSLSVTVFENTPVGTTLVSTQPGRWRRYSVTDRDTGPNGVITYTLVNITGSSTFNLDRNTGSLTLVRSLDVDNTQSGIDRVLVNIRACDEDPPRADCPNLQVSVIVLSSNDNNPVFSSDQYEVHLPETSPVGTIVATPECTDADVGAGQYQGIELASNERDLFVIPDSRSGTVVLNGTLDFETSQTHNIILVCRDTQRHSSTAQIILNVIPENNKPLRFNQSTFEFTINRLNLPNTEVGRVIAIDEDEIVGNRLTYTLEGDTNNFNIEDNGLVKLNDFIYVTESSIFVLTVNVSDGTFSATSMVIITVEGILSVPEIAIILVAAFVLLCVLVTLVLLYVFARRGKYLKRYHISCVTVKKSASEVNMEECKAYGIATTSINTNGNTTANEQPNIDPEYKEIPV